ncbi:translation initiation factor IF-2-like [Cebus imitator]|uniref:translation initiation factor IF-2-like n=1 Tax=Cebus imitator TaxID=2715852 RepID=UPI0018979302|nr:translation initiation factor IF-2-like [Cebus imitator]
MRVLVATASLSPARTERRPAGIRARPSRCPPAFTAPSPSGSGRGVPGSAGAGSGSPGAAPSFVPLDLAWRSWGWRENSPLPKPTAARAGLPFFPPAQAAPPPQSPVRSGSPGPHVPRPEPIRSRPLVHLQGCSLPSPHSRPLHLVRVPGQCEGHPEAPGGPSGEAGAAIGAGRLNGVPWVSAQRTRSREGCQVEHASLCVFPALLENKTEPGWRRMRSLTMAVPTEKAAIRQAMPRGRRRRGTRLGLRGRG